MLDNQTTTPPMTFDRASLLDRVDGDDELLAMVVDVFLDDAPQSLRAIQSAFEAADHAGLGLAAHALKGAAANISAEVVRAAAHDLEQAAQTGPASAIDAGVRRVQEAMSALVPVLAAERGR